MRLIFIRHAEPDYSCDGLTEKGKKEAQLLGERVAKWKVDAFYCSPLGRAKDTAAPALTLLNTEAITLDWIREYSYPIHNPTHKGESVCWDFIPSDWADTPEMYTASDWLNIEPAVQNDMLRTMYDKVINGIDDIIKDYGLIRHGNYYINTKPKNRRFTSTVVDMNKHIANELPEDDADPVLVFFCHFGVTALILSHLLNIPFPLLAQGTIIPPTGVTIVNSEERWDDQAYFRLQSLGDVSHLINNNEKISAAGSFAPLFQG